MSAPSGKVTVPGLKKMKIAGERISAVTAHDYPSGLIADHAEIDVILVGDSLANTVLGYPNTLPVTLDEMLAALRAARRAVSRALLVGDLPFGTYHEGDARALSACISFLKAGAEAVKLEGGERRAELVRRLVESEVPVMGHIGLTPQSVHVMGGYKMQGKTPESAGQILEDALALEAAGAFAVVIEGVPSMVAAEVTARLEVPTIGIGAGLHCDGQILVFSDLLGILPGKKPRFVRQYLDLHSLATEALAAYRRDVLSGAFPAARETYEVPEVPLLRRE
ncbi:MAG TPA: 3-methyl-2-oxobutanoate hydroxymethyltransferase [Planctomycetota bacterium]|nr:3-methyl-2-oxobutanoate hydroxymethyltransferase [Planctomycetota bacterium]